MMLEQIIAALKEAGLVVYDMAEKAGICKSPYAVAYDHGTDVIPGTKGMLGKHLFEVICYAPYTDKTALPRMELQAHRAMASIGELIFGGSSGTGIEETYQARAVSLTWYTMERLY